MASAPLEDIKQAIKEEGFWVREDASIGKRVDHLVQNGFKFKTNEGIGLLETALDKTRETIESFFERSGLGFYKIYGQTKHDHCVINSTPELRILVVFAWSSRSEVSLRYGSHLHALSATSARNGLLKRLDESDDFKLPGIRTESKEMEDGGLAIGDARAWWRVLKGKIILLGFMVPDELRYWHRMPLPPYLKDRVQKLASSTINMDNFVFEESQTGTDA